MTPKLTAIKSLIEEISMGPFGSDIKVENFIDSGVPVLNGSNLSGVKLNEDDFKYVSEEKAISLKKANARAGDIVITHRGTLGQISYIPNDSRFDKYVISQSQFRVRFDSNKVDPVFITYYFHTNEGQKRLLANKSYVGVPALAQATTNFRRIEIPLPNLASQQKIAKVLSALDAKIELNNRINAELEAMAKLLYDYWFVQFDFPMTAAQAAALGKPHLKGQPYKSSGGKMVYNPILKREIPEGWEDGTLNQALTLCYGKPLKKEMQSQGPYPVYGSNGVYGYHKTPLVKGPGIIIGRKGTVGSVTWEHGDFFATDTSYYVEPKSFYSMVYVFHLLKSLRLDLMNTDSAVPGLSRTYAYMRTFASPASGTIEAFNKVSMPLRNQIHINQKQNQELTTLRDWLLPMLMNGQVTVN